MLWTRALTRSVSRLLIGVVLLTQFAVASYACPGLMPNAAPGVLLSAATSGPLQAHAAPEPAAMPPGCDQMDPAAAALCAEHCHPTAQSSHTASAAEVGTSLPALLYALPRELLQAPGTGRAGPSGDAGLAAAPEPPHAILHCVFRI